MIPFPFIEYRIVAERDGEITELEDGFVNRSDAERIAASYRSEWQGYNVYVEQY